nr:hypothetical protein [Tanacetum cinerariifolium]
MLKIQKSIRPLSGSTTSSSFDSFPSLTSFETSDSLLEEFADELAQSDNNEWKKLLYGDSFKEIDSEKDKSKDSKTKLLIDEANIVESNVLPP